MPTVDLESRREYRRRYYAANIEREREARRQSSLRYYRRNRDEIRARDRQKTAERRAARPVMTEAERRERDRETRRAYYAKNREKILAQDRARYAANPARDRVNQQRQRAAHAGMDWGATWDAQCGRCYLCGDPLGAQPHVDHDHACCPKGRSCAACRRGIACHHCNVLLGFVHDDLDKLERILRTAQAVFAETNERIAAKPCQETLI